MLTYTTWLVSSLIIGLICAAVAKIQGKNPLNWFLAGFLLNILVLGAIGIMKVVKTRKTAGSLHRT